MYKRFLPKIINIVEFHYSCLLIVAQTENISDPIAYAIRVDIMPIKDLFKDSLVSLLLSRIYYK